MRPIKVRRLPGHEKGCQCASCAYVRHANRRNKYIHKEMRDFDRKILIGGAAALLGLWLL